MKRWDLIGLISLSLFTLILVGCVAPMSYKGREATREISPSTALRFNDIPVPETFRFDYQNSYVFEDKLSRLGVLKYITTISPEEIIMFFKQEMPNAGWRFVNIVEYGQKTLTYEKEKETCVINILQGMTQSTVVISITPHQYGSGYSEDKGKQKRED